MPINDEERVLMKEEFENHILEHIDELRMVGYSEQQAIQQALQSFGEAHYIEKEMKKYCSLIINGYAFVQRLYLQLLHYVLAPTLFQNGWSPEMLHLFPSV